MIKEMTDEFIKRRDIFLDGLQTMAGISCQKSNGAFYLFPNISALFGKKYNGKTLNSSIDIAEYLLNEAKVVVVPGSGFGADNFIRISYTNSVDNLEKGIERMKKALEKLNDN